MTVQIFQILAYFNPRSREGSDQNLRWKISAATEISIHAPARGATYPSPLSKMVYNHFNPRSREGSDYDPLMVLTAVTNFNPRSREGSDICSTHCQQDSYIISIHAPARGATAAIATTARQNTNFNPRSREGSDVTGNPELVEFTEISIHAPARGAT